MDPKPVSRRLLLASAAALSSGVGFPGTALAAPPDDVGAGRVPTDQELEALRGRMRGRARPPKAAMLRNLPNSPYFAPVGKPLDNNEQQLNRPGASSGPRL